MNINNLVKAFLTKKASSNTKDLLQLIPLIIPSSLETISQDGLIDWVNRLVMILNTQHPDLAVTLNKTSISKKSDRYDFILSVGDFACTIHFSSPTFTEGFLDMKSNIKGFRLNSYVSFSSLAQLWIYLKGLGTAHLLMWGLKDDLSDLISTSGVFYPSWNIKVNSVFSFEAISTPPTNDSVAGPISVNVNVLMDVFEYELKWTDNKQVMQTIYKGPNFDELLDSVPEEHDDMLILFNSQEFLKTLSDKATKALAPVAKLRNVEFDSNVLFIRGILEKQPLNIILIYDATNELWGLKSIDFGLWRTDQDIEFKISKLESMLPQGIGLKYTPRSMGHAIQGFKINIDQASLDDLLDLISKLLKALKKNLK